VSKSLIARRNRARFLLHAQNASQIGLIVKIPQERLAEQLAQFWGWLLAHQLLSQELKLVPYSA
jgi:hypothetical protein